MTAPFRVVAIIAMFNEADIIVRCILALNEQGVLAYVLDDGSTDESVSLVEPLVGHGVIELERLASDDTFSLTRILRRKEQVAEELDADWFINHDADEFRESPWPGVTLAEALHRVDAAGYNAVDFVLLDFWPAHTDGQATIEGSQYSPGLAYNSRQVRCWKRGSVPVDLVTSAGHDVSFPSRRVFPLRFLLKHYPIRSAEPAARKVWQERIPRFDQLERERGWHVQYDTLSREARSIPRPDTLIAFRPERIRMDSAVEDMATSAAATDAALRTLQADVTELRAALGAAQQQEARHRECAAEQDRAVTELQAERTALLAQQQQLEGQLSNARAALDHAESEAADLVTRLGHAQHEARELRLSLDARESDLRALATRLAESDRERTQLESERERLLADIAGLLGELDGMRQSRTWRWSAAIRRLAAALGRR